jgi:hypothetical protein
MADTLIVNAGTGDELDSDNTPTLFLYDQADDSLSPNQLLGVSMASTLKLIPLRYPQIILVS